MYYFPLGIALSEQLSEWYSKTFEFHQTDIRITASSDEDVTDSYSGKLLVN